MPGALRQWRSAFPCHNRLRDYGYVAKLTTYATSETQNLCDVGMLALESGRFAYAQLRTNAVWLDWRQ